MTVGHAGVGAFSHGSVSCSPPFPASPVAGNLFVLFVMSGEQDGTVPDTPAGWTAPPNNSHQGGGGTFGEDAGPRRVTVFTKTSDGTETGTVTVTIGGTAAGRVISGVMAMASKTAGQLAVEVTGGEDTTAGTDYSATAAATLALDAGDLIYTGNALVPDTATVSAQSVSATGVTFGSPAFAGMATGANTGGNDMRPQAGRGGVTAGPASGPVTLSMTWSTAVTGATAFVRVFEVIQANVGSAAETDTAQPVARSKTRTVQASAETDAALQLGRSKARAVSAAAETEAALPIGRVKIRAAGRADEVDVALALATDTVARGSASWAPRTVPSLTGVPRR